MTLPATGPALGPSLGGHTHGAASLPRALYRARDVQALDRIAIDDFAIPGAELMTRAGRATYRALLERWPAARRLDIVCGPGNNGADGFVIARLAARDGTEVRVHTLGDLSRSGPDAQAMRVALNELPVPVDAFQLDALAGAEVVVDALLGVGLARDVEGEWARAIEAMNGCGAPVVAVDIPSGLSADTGRELGVCVQANLTVTYIGVKRGMLTGAGPASCGEVLFDALSVPDEVYPRVPTSVVRVDRDDLRQLEPRRRDSHKGTHGHVLVLGGDAGYAGAARLAGEAAARAGAGLVSIGTHKAHASTLNIGRAELMVRAVEGSADLEPLSERANVIALGPGLGQGAWAEPLFEHALGAGLPLVVDADGLNRLARSPMRRTDWVLTPHPAEAGRLLGVSATDVQADRFAAVRAIAARYGGVCVLKGVGTLIARAEGTIALCSDGNPGLAAGGSGDVLTGIIAALMAQGLALESAARLGVCAHAFAADRVAGRGERGMLASDVLDELVVSVNRRPIRIRSAPVSRP